MEALKEKNRSYKKCINKSYKKYQKEFKNKLRKCKNSNPKLYWKLLNCGKKGSCKANIMDLYNHFKEINCKGHGDGDDSINIENLIDIGNINEYLDVDISEVEIKTVVKRLKNGKASGIDGILNEYLITSVDILMPVYMELFNRVLSNGSIPQDWLIGIV